jgi:hypothetical protein
MYENYSRQISKLIGWHLDPPREAT